MVEHFGGGEFGVRISDPEITKYGGFYVKIIGNTPNNEYVIEVIEVIQDYEWKAIYYYNVDVGDKYIISESTLSQEFYTMNELRAYRRKKQREQQIKEQRQVFRLPEDKIDA